MTSLMIRDSEMNCLILCRSTSYNGIILYLFYFTHQYSINWIVSEFMMTSKFFFHFLEEKDLIKGERKM